MIARSFSLITHPAFPKSSEVMASPWVRRQKLHPVLPRLSPAYDIVTTSVYMENEHEFALNLGRAKDWYHADMAQFQSWAEKANIPWRAIQPHLLDVLDKARAEWPKALRALPMATTHKQALTNHWQRLHPDFRIG